jgi:hypothetical protein
MTSFFSSTGRPAASGNRQFRHVYENRHDRNIARQRFADLNTNVVGWVIQPLQIVNPVRTDQREQHVALADSILEDLVEIGTERNGIVVEEDVVGRNGSAESRVDLARLILAILAAVADENLRAHGSAVLVRVSATFYHLTTTAVTKGTPTIDTRRAGGFLAMTRRRSRPSRL